MQTKPSILNLLGGYVGRKLEREDIPDAAISLVTEILLLTEATGHDAEELMQKAAVRLNVALEREFPQEDIQYKSSGLEFKPEADEEEEE